MRFAAVSVVAALVLTTPIAGTAETKRRDFHYRTRGMVRLLFFWIGKDDVGGGRISFLEPQAERGEEWTDGIEVIFGSRPDRVPGGHNRWGYAKELAFWRTADGSGDILDSVRFEGFMTAAHEESIDDVVNADMSEALYEGAISIVEASRAEATLWRFLGPRGETYENSDLASGEYLTLRNAEPDLERTLVNENTYGPPYGFLTALRGFVEEALRAEANTVPFALKSSKPYVHNARAYTLYLEKARLRENLKLSDERRHERVLELRMKTKNDLGKTHVFALFLATKGELRGVPLRIEDSLRWWLKVRLDLDEGHLPSD